MPYDLTVLKADFLEGLTLDELKALVAELLAMEAALNGAGGTLLRMTARRIEKKQKAAQE